jgi:uncharacterized protein (TIGR03089 family)
LERLVDISPETRFSTVPAIFRSAVAADPTRPLLTYYDDATGERTELSGATLDNWVAKTANLLVDGCGLVPGDVAAVLLPPHWQTAAVLLGAWSAGLAAGPAGPVRRAIGEAHQPDVAFVAADRIAEAPAATDRFVLGLAPMALPLRQVPAGFVDYVAEVRTHGDHFQPYAPVGSEDPAFTDGTNHREVVSAARELARTRGLGPDDRVLVDAARWTRPLEWLLVALSVGASIVLCANADPGKLDARREAERITHVLT